MEPTGPKKVNVLRACTLFGNSYGLCAYSEFVAATLTPAGLWFCRRARGMCCGVKQVKRWPGVVKSCCSGCSGFWWRCVDGPCEALDHSVLWVNDPAAAFDMKDCAMVLLKKVHSLLFTTTGEFGAGSPGYQGDKDGMGVLGKVPRVVEDAGLLCVVVL